ncbi:spike base protein, RCAP_Rcc01079 family [Paenirhodobacter populi]|uniref:SGNH hydrolase-type esterase domain-containing protein n=1 Tax=Paenirhodobacter populi TaxID=2306993 RepID=A0A443JKM2_9RHOB|nr:SGNH/GDSL hydrolase family protein [Sinirhodobacter populi]RWR21139.1 hypothetical protein D2T30_09860 [Sinirhodobacter populi]
MTIDLFADRAPNMAFPRNAVPITPSDTEALEYAADSLWIGSAGNVRLKTISGQIATFKNIASGTILSVRTAQVFATDTTAGSIVGLGTWPIATSTNEEPAPVEPAKVMLAGPRYATNGDSQIQMTQSGYRPATVGRSINHSVSGWSAPLHDLLGWKLRQVSGEGTGGTTTAQILSATPQRVADAVASGADFAFIIGGGNDGPSADINITIDNMTAIYDLYEAAGIQQVTYIVPKNGAPTHVARRAWFADVEERRKRWPRYIYVDVWNELANPANDPDSAGGPGINPLYSEDNTHLNTLGSRVLAQTLATKLAPLMPADFGDVAPNLNTPIVPAFITQTTGGTITNNSTATVTGQLPTGLTMTIPEAFNGCSIALSTNLSGGVPELAVHVTGRTGEAVPAMVGGATINIAPAIITDTAILNALSEGDVLGTYADLTIDAGSKGARWSTAFLRFAGNGHVSRELSTGSTGTASLQYPANNTDTVTRADRANVAWTHRALTPGMPLKSNWVGSASRSVTSRIDLNTNAAGEVDATFRIKNFKLVKAHPTLYPWPWI